MNHSTASRYLHDININICAMNTRFIYIYLYIYVYTRLLFSTFYGSTEQSLFSFYEHSMLPEIWQKAFCVGEKSQE